MKDIFLGMALFADTINLKDPQTATLVLTGHYDDILLKTFFWVAHGRAAEAEEYKTDARTVSNLVRCKDRIRDDIRYIFELHEAAEQVKKTLAFQRLQNELRQSNKPHEKGTVAEIAAKLGISKSEVRRRKADGTLDELFAEKGIS